MMKNDLLCWFFYVHQCFLISTIIVLQTGKVEVWKWSCGMLSC
ncbi:hypothetical protein RchiOBHm_Chr4g0401191 [Rosa chinensis]|uniref:Uncharacterized protein n=1 Tax=Rosa chinensis TaxID=74649 RepID=A0A2P6QT19_ROSCH|nr:hypothetical protein RchiOBHm_Chr4g0401191 [Rosa chinensis]